jgi:hypothetical protein
MIDTAKPSRSLPLIADRCPLPSTLSLSFLAIRKTIFAKQLPQQDNNKAVDKIKGVCFAYPQEKRSGIRKRPFELTSFR